MPTRNCKLTLAYDGGAYAGWQSQPHGVTIQQVIEGVLGQIDKKPVALHGSGRTDAGVHARAQVASCRLQTPLTARVLRQAINAHLPADIRVNRIQFVDADFHARFSATGKEYRYFIDTSPVADPFQRGYCWHRPQPLDLAAMRRAARELKGTHDFRALSANPMRKIDTPVRTVRRLTIRERDAGLVITAVADGFLYKMVRTIVGALVKVGEGRLGIDGLIRLRDAKTRTAQIETAPAHGLFLWRVIY